MNIIAFCLPLLLLATSSLLAEPPVILPGNPAIPAENYRSPLWEALEAWEHQIAEQLDPSSPKVAAAHQNVIRALEQGANPNDHATQDAVFITPLIIAAQRQDLPLLHLLLEKGADPNRAENKNLLDAIIRTNRPDILRLLIAKGWKFDPNLPGGCEAHISGWPRLPLLSAVSQQSLLMVEALLQLGADPYLTEISNPDWAKRAATGWQPSKENAFQVCEQITLRTNPQHQTGAQTKQAVIKILLNRDKNDKEKLIRTRIGG